MTSKFSMPRSTKNSATTSRAFLLAELSKLFQQNPNRNFNYKQLSKQLKPAWVEFMTSQDGKTDTAALHLELKNEIAGLLENMKEKEEVIETTRGSYKLKPSHSYQ